MQKILITGGAGFIGSNFVRHILNTHQDYEVVVLDALTYAGNLNNLKEVKDKIKFIKGDIRDPKAVEEAMKGCDFVVHFAAETHVDRSITDPTPFITTNVLGTGIMLEAARKLGIKKFVHISTDEVYGSINSGSFKETDPLMARNSYSASKLGAEKLAYSYWCTYGLPVIITRSSNNYGPKQHPEKLIPKLILNAMHDKPLPIYGKGQNIRDWLFVSDNCKAIDIVLHKGKNGEVYNIGGGEERTNIEIANMICELLGKSKELINFVPDRLGHDFRYSLDCSKIKHELGWTPTTNLSTGLAQKVEWYKNNRWWWEALM